MPDMYLGGPIDPETGDRIAGERTLFDAGDLTTHGVIVGMTGSGKTGLGVIYLEEALRSGIPTLVLDPKGDMTNLLLTFPELSAEDFAPWVEPDKDQDRMEAASGTAELWRNGLASWELDGSDIGALRERADFTIYTPGSTTGVPLNIIGSLQPPAGDWSDPEPLRDEIQGITSGLLGLVGEDTDPVSSRAHILISNLIEHAWRSGSGLDMTTLLGWIQDPPLRKLGVFDVNTFFPAKDRTELALRLNGLLASPGFEAWTQGAPLDIDGLLWDESGKPRAAIVYLAHLSDEERQFAVTLVLSKLITWMRSQPGSDHLRVLAYMDEVYGFVPPVAEPPSKRAILTIMKQGRAFGVGMLLSTQNPVDLDYKAMSNAGTWCVGRLQTERDKARILEALASATGDVDVADLDARVSGLGKRRFLLHSTKRAQPRLFTTRWAMSYLRGPLTRDQIKKLQGDRAPAVSPTAPAAAQPTATLAEPPHGMAGGDDAAVPLMPAVPDRVTVGYMSPSAPWASQVGARQGSDIYEAALAVTVSTRYDEAKADVDHTEEWEAIYHPLGVAFDAEAAVEVDHDPRDFVPSVAQASYTLPEAPIDTKAYYNEVTRSVKDHLRQTGRIEVYRNTELRLYSRVGESREAFTRRCEAAADDGADEAAAKLRDRYKSRLRTAQRTLDTAQDRADAARDKVAGYQQDAMMNQAGAVFDLLMGRKRSRSITGGSSRRRSAERSAGTAARKVAEEQADLEELDRDLLDELDEIAAVWGDKAQAVEPLEIGLERDDVVVKEVSLVWIPR
jgi:hypothetical protein